MSTRTVCVVWCTPSLRRDSTIVTVCMHTVTFQLDNDCNVFKIVPHALFSTSRRAHRLYLYYNNYIGCQLKLEYHTNCVLLCIKSPTELRHYISSNSVNLAQTCVYVLRHAATINCHVPRTNRRFTISSFSISAPTVWIIVCLTISVAHLLSLFPNQAQDPPFQYLIFSPSACNLISFYNNYCVFLFLICCNKRPRALVVGRYSKFLRFDLI